MILAISWGIMDQTELSYNYPCLFSRTSKLIVACQPDLSVEIELWYWDDMDIPKYIGEINIITRDF